MRIVVTGGAGFIGSHVVDILIHAGHEILVIDDFSTGVRSNVNAEANLVELDIRDRDRVTRAISDFRPDVVNHQAAQCRVPSSMADPIMDAEVNIIGGLNVVWAAIRSGARKFIFSSSGGAIYGDPTTIPCDEDSPIRPLSPYGAAKYCFEQYLAMFERSFELDYTILRYANVYGPRQSVEQEEGRVIATFIERMLSGMPITIDGSGEQARDMIYVDDVASANLAALANGSGGCFNIGTGIPVTINALFRELKDILRYPGEPIYGPARDGDVYRIALDCRRAHEALAWTPAVTLANGLQRTVDYVRTHTEPAATSITPQTSLPDGMPFTRAGES